MARKKRSPKVYMFAVNGGRPHRRGVMGYEDAVRALAEEILHTLQDNTAMWDDRGHAFIISEIGLRMAKLRELDDPMTGDPRRNPRGS